MPHIRPRPIFAHAQCSSTPHIRPPIEDLFTGLLTRLLAKEDCIQLSGQQIEVMGLQEWATETRERNIYSNYVPLKNM